MTTPTNRKQEIEAAVDRLVARETQDEFVGDLWLFVQPSMRKPYRLALSSLNRSEGYETRDELVKAALERLEGQDDV